MYNVKGIELSWARRRLDISLKYAAKILNIDKTQLQIWEESDIIIVSSEVLFNFTKLYLLPFIDFLDKDNPYSLIPNNESINERG
jgi:hypothetical protein